MTATVVWEHVSYQPGDRCELTRWCLRRPRWVVQSGAFGERHSLACNRHRPR